jgi:WD40 repeat protein
VAPAVHAADKPAKITFDEHIAPLLRDKCVGCHNPDKSRGGLILSNYQKIMQGGSSGEAVKAGDPDGSRLYLMLTHKQEPFMPPKSDMLAKETLDLVRQWIADGLLENSGSKAKVADKPKTDIGLKSIVKGKPEGPPPMPEKPLQLEPVIRTAKANALTALACSPWAPLVAVGGQKQVILYNSETLEFLGILPFPEGTPHVLKFSRNGSLLLVGGGRGGKSGRVVVWNVKTGERVIEVGDEPDVVLAADISADQTQIALGGPSKMIRIYATKDGSLIREIKKHTDWITALEFSPDAVLLATGDRNGGLFVWEAHTGREYFSLRGHAAAITDVSWRMDSNVLASASEDTTIRLWEMENGNPIKNWGAHGGGVQSVKYSHDGRIASCGRDKVARVWDGNGTAQRPFEAQPDVSLKIAFRHDGSRVIAGDWSGQIAAYATADGKFAGLLTSNPPTLAERVDLIQKEIVAKQTAVDQANAVAAASQAAATKAAMDLAAAQKAVTDIAMAAKVAGEAVTKDKAAVDKANAAVAGAQTQVTAKDVVAKAYAEAAAKIKDAAAKAKDNKTLADAAAKSQDLANQAASDLAAAQKAATDLTAGAKIAGDLFAKAQQAAANATAAAAAAPKQAEALTALVKATAAKAIADKAAAEQTSAALAVAKKSLEKWQAAVTVAKQPAK